MKLSENEIKDRLPAFKNWKYSNGKISKTYSLESFEKAITLVNQIALIAENLQHHPDIDIRYNKVTFSSSTHDEGGVTEKDFTLAKQIEQAAVMNL